MLLTLFGTSIPTAAFPGIGASIRISAAARFNLISSARDRIRLTFTPCSGCNSYRVTVGPQLIFVTVTPTPKFLNVCWSLIAVSLNSCSDCPATEVSFFKRSSGGITYGFFGFSSVCLISFKTSFPASSLSMASRFLASAFFCMISSVSVSMTFPEAVTT